MTTARSYSNPRGMTYPTAVMLNTTINTERRISTVAGSGGVSVAYTTNLTGIPASVQDGSSSEAIRYAADRGEQTYDVWVEAGHDITTADRIVHGSDTYGIIARRDMAGRGRVLHFICTKTEGVPA